MDVQAIDAMTLRGNGTRNYCSTDLKAIGFVTNQAKAGLWDCGESVSSVNNQAI
jgi:hypothetical protein